MLLWPLLLLGAVLAGAGLVGVLWWWPNPTRCVAAAFLLVAGAVVDFVAADARTGAGDGDVAAVVLVVLAGVELAAVLTRRGTSEDDGAP